MALEIKLMTFFRARKVTNVAMFSLRIIAAIIFTGIVLHQIVVQLNYFTPFNIATEQFTFCKDLQ